MAWRQKRDCQQRVQQRRAVVRLALGLAQGLRGAGELTGDLLSDERLETPPEEPLGAKARREQLPALVRDRHRKLAFLSAT